MNGEPEVEYLAYLLRLWLVSTEAGSVWRASLQCPETGERFGFAGLEALFTFLSEKTAGCAANALPADRGPRPQGVEEK